MQETNFEGEIVFKCEKCGWLYRDAQTAEKCEKYCRKHKACSLEFVKHAIKMKGGKTK